LKDEISELKKAVTNEQQKSRRQLLEANLERKEHEKESTAKEALILQLKEDAIQVTPEIWYRSFNRCSSVQRSDRNSRTRNAK